MRQTLSINILFFSEKSGDFLGLHSKSIDHADGDDSMALTEYAEYTGMNMEHVQNKTNLDKIKDCSAKDSPSFELFLKSANEVPQDLSIHNKEEIKINPPPVDFSSLDFNSINFTGNYIVMKRYICSL